MMTNNNTNTTTNTTLTSLEATALIASLFTEEEVVSDTEGNVPLWVQEREANAWKEGYNHAVWTLCTKLGLDPNEYYSPWEKMDIK